MCNVKCMIHLDLRYAYNHFDSLILVYTMILSLQQAFQGLTPNGFFFLHSMLKLRCLNLKTPECFWGRDYTEYRSIIVDNVTLRLAPDKFPAARI